jgi:hypothetical protein
MEPRERDRMVLSLLERDDRAKIDSVVDEIIEDELAAAVAAYVLAAAGAFDARAETAPDDEKVVDWQIAAALRERARPLGAVH